MTSILFGFLSALGWGAADFLGGLASRKTQAQRTVLYSEIFGIVFLLLLILFTGEENPNLRVWALSALAGALGTIGLIMLYHAMSIGLMSIATPVSALLAATLPVAVGMFTEGLPNWLTLLGFLFALFAVWMISQGEHGVTNVFAHISDLKLPLLAGIGFGMYFVIMREATREGATLYPMVASRSGGLLLTIVYMAFARISWKVQEISTLGIIVFNAILDVSGNAFFILASQSGRLDVAAVLSSLYPGATVLLARLILKENLSKPQWVGILSALIAIMLMTL
ncbi:MAG: DMT family transporter [Anaerolineales bacterium]